VNPTQFRARYAAAFTAFMAERSEQSLRSAYELGRDAVKAELSMLEIAVAHHETLTRVLADAAPDEIAAISDAAGDFLVESLAAFEMVQRGYSDARRAAFIERRNARMLRQLSTLLADASLATREHEPLEEILQLVAEHAREMTDARCGVVHINAAVGATGIDVRSEFEGDDAWTEVLQPREAAQASAQEEPDAIHVPLLSLDGTVFGWLKVEDKQSGSFSQADRALLTQVAQMTAAAVERALAYK
jgi:hypothetical protein